MAGFVITPKTVSVSRGMLADCIMRRPYWTLNWVGSWPDAPTYELRVRYDAVETAFTRSIWTEGDETRVLPRAEFKETVDRFIEHEEPPGAALHYSPRAAAEELELRGTREMTKTEVEIFAALEKIWSAFETLFNPAYTL